MPNYRIPYGDIPWSIMIVMVIVKITTFFILKPIAWIKKQAKRQVWQATVTIFFLLFILSAIIEGLTRITAKASAFGELFSFIKLVLS